MTESNYIVDILVLLAAAIIAVPLFQRLGFGSVLGYLFAGAIVGPWGLGYIDQVDEIQHIAEFGVVFLLFVIAIELKPERLWDMRRMVFGLGTLQVLLTGLAITAIAMQFGLTAGTAIIIGFGLALSSTAFGLQILTERGEINTGHGKAAFSILLLQDLAVVPLLTLVSLLAARTPLLEGIEFAILEAALAIVGVFLIGRFLLTPILNLVARSRTAEVFTASAVFAVLGTAWLMEEVGLSLALGAFLAGLMMADSHYRHQLVADIEPFRGILLGLFFMSVGMSVDFGLLGQQGMLIVGLVAGLLLIKSSINWILCRFMGVSAPDATRASLLLSQSGEFGFVIFGLAAITGILHKDLFNMLTLIVAVSMVATPLMVSLGEYINRLLAPGEANHDVSTEHLNLADTHVIIAGFGRIGQRIAKILEAAQVPYIAIESNADRVLEGRKDGFSVFYGNANRVDVLKAAGAGQASVVVCTLDQPVASVRLVRILRQHYPNIAIHARGRDRQHCDQLLKAGATMAISETLEASLQIGGETLKAMGVFEENSSRIIESFRQEYYE
ncbi:MAG: monovalent cation:proton antiporter-2 (CPA2) family protein [Gammaproteobacteria bacterium]|nr:monovalent cation:proton antiporter-2 (CPA2) family protein [Gammaproteobacteria bacterium]